MLNKCFLIGRLTEDPQKKDVSGGNVRTTFRLAVNRVWKDSNGEKQEEATFVPIVCWGKTAENVAKYQIKGKRVLVEGRLRMYTVDGDDGVRKYFTEVVAQNVEFLDSREDSERAKPVYNSTTPYGGNEEVPF